MSIWSTFTYVLLPPAVLLLMLITIPFPRAISGLIVKFTDFTLSIQIGTVSVFSFITLVSALVAFGQTWNLYTRYDRGSMKDPIREFGYAADLHQKASRWRLERNFWISTLTFTIYWMILRFHAMKKRLLKAQEKKN